jgi:rhamnose utilization protein RhaD (predicted bifunctional aldolase and dehydrogenase)
MRNLLEQNTILTDLVKLSHELGREDRRLVILGEGNTSADCGDGTFWVKASGGQLAAIDEKGFSRIRMDAVLELMTASQLTDEGVAEGLKKVLADPSYRKPSVETFLHALCLREAGVKWVGHTHPISVNQILCSRLGAEPFLRPIYPDQIVVCGVNPAVVPYVDPGFSLALAFRTALRQYLDRHGHAPKLLLMEKHGMVALGGSPAEVLNISLMADKIARVIQGTYALGGPSPLSEQEAERIETRQDEHYRRSMLAGR